MNASTGIRIHEFTPSMDVDFFSFYQYAHNRQFDKGLCTQNLKVREILFLRSSKTLQLYSLWLPLSLTANPYLSSNLLYILSSYANSTKFLLNTMFIWLLRSTNSGSNHFVNLAKIYAKILIKSTIYYIVRIQDP